MIRKILIILFLLMCIITLSFFLFLQYPTQIPEDFVESNSSQDRVVSKNLSQTKIDDFFNEEGLEFKFYQITNKNNQHSYWSKEAPHSDLKFFFLEVFTFQKNTEGFFVSRQIGLGSADGGTRFDYQFDPKGNLKSMKRSFGYIAGTGSFSGEILYAFIENSLQIREFHYWSRDDEATEIYVNDEKIGTGRVSWDIIEQYGVENITQMVKVSDEESVLFTSETIDSINGEMNEGMIILSLEELVNTISLGLVS